jgi:hypothetical protein
MPPMTIMLCGRGSSKLSSERKVIFSSCSLRSVTLGLWWRMRSARRREEAEKFDVAEQEEKKEPGENSSDSRRERGDVVDVEEVLEA